VIKKNANEEVKGCTHTGSEYSAWTGNVHENVGKTGQNYENYKQKPHIIPPLLFSLLLLFIILSLHSWLFIPFHPLNFLFGLRGLFSWGNTDFFWTSSLTAIVHFYFLFFIALLFPPRPKLLSPIRPCVSHSHAHVNASQIHKPHPAAALEPSPPLPSLARAHARLV